jgi:phosphomannomutase
VIDLGVSPTPTPSSVHGWRPGGVHWRANPAAWNALKFVRGDGLYLNTAQAEELLDIVHQNEYEKATWDRIRTGVAEQDAIGHHLEALAAAFDVDAARRRGLRVAVDCCNGASALLSPQWLEMLGCTVLAVNDDISAPFPHRPEPKPETRSLSRRGGGAMSDYHDADGERPVWLPMARRPEERTLTLAAPSPRVPGTAVTNVSTTRPSTRSQALRRNDRIPETFISRADRAPWSTA